MRSKTLCLLFCLTSCFADLYPLYKEDKYFCNADIKRSDCADTRIDNNDFEWSLKTAFNQQKEVPKTKFVEVDMHRALYIEAGANDVTAFLVAKDKYQCKIILRQNGKSNSDKFFIVDLDKQFIVKKNENVIFFVFDPECRLYVERSDKLLNAKRLHHIFSRNINSLDLPKEVLTKNPDNDGNANRERGLGNFIVSQASETSGKRAVRVEILKYNQFFPFKNIKKIKELSDNKECHHLCKYGSIFEFTVTKGMNFANTFKLKKTCEWMTVHLDESEKSFATEISLRHGFVTLPTELKAYPMEFERSGDLSSTNDAYYEVLYTYYTTSDNSDDVSNIVVANRHGRAVRAIKTLPSSDTLTFAFSADDCLVAVIGSEVSSGTDKMKDYEFEKGLNLGYRVVGAKEYKSVRYARKPEGDNTNTYTFHSHVFGDVAPNDTNIKKLYIPEFNAEITTTTPESIVTKDAPTDKPIVEVYYTKRDQLQEEITSKANERKEAVKKALEDASYKFWAIPAGFGAGSIITFAIANIILLVFRRSVLTFWYKAMYKRYGSDTTMGAGTTMGKTGAGETVGGSMTAGGTTAGETMGSTTAA